MFSIESKNNPHQHQDLRKNKSKDRVFALFCRKIFATRKVSGDWSILLFCASMIVGMGLVIHIPTTIYYIPGGGWTRLDSHSTYISQRTRNCRVQGQISKLRDLSKCDLSDTANRSRKTNPAELIHNRGERRRRARSTSSSEFFAEN